MTSGNCAADTELALTYAATILAAKRRRSGVSFIVALSKCWVLSSGQRVWRSSCDRHTARFAKTCDQIGGGTSVIRLIFQCTAPAEITWCTHGRIERNRPLRTHKTWISPVILM